MKYKIINSTISANQPDRDNVKNKIIVMNKIAKIYQPRTLILSVSKDNRKVSGITAAKTSAMALWFPPSGLKSPKANGMARYLNQPGPLADKTDKKPIPATINPTIKNACRTRQNSALSLIIFIGNITNIR